MIAKTRQLGRRTYLWRIWLVVRVFAYTFLCYRRVVRASASSSDPAQALQAVRSVGKRWAIRLLEWMGIAHRIYGEPLSPTPCIIVANHMSYTDIPALMSEFPVVFVSKIEVKSFFAIGPGAAAAGIIFVDRKSPQSKRLVAQALAEAVAVQKKWVVVFPEGTSSWEGKPWKRGVFRVAADMKIRVQVMAIRYLPSRPQSYFGDDVLVPHLWRLLGLRNKQVEIEVGPCEIVTEPEASCRKAEAWVQERTRRWLQEEGQLS